MKRGLFKYYESGRDTVGGTAKIVFNNYSEGKDLKYLWQFGDGSTSTEKEPVLKFSLNQPEYKVCLTTTSADSCINTFYKLSSRDTWILFTYEPTIFELYNRVKLPNRLNRHNILIFQLVIFTRKRMKIQKVWFN